MAKKETTNHAAPVLPMLKTVEQMSKVTALYNLLYARVEFGHHLGTIYGKSTMKTEGKRNADNSQKRSVHAGFRRFPIP